MSDKEKKLTEEELEKAHGGFKIMETEEELRDPEKPKKKRFKFVEPLDDPKGGFRP